MKKIMKKASALLLALVLLMGLMTIASADGSVTYDGSAKEFIFAPGSEYSPTDLFTNFKGVMPGDQLTEQIVVKNTADKKVDVKIYMRALGAQLDTDEFLSQMTLDEKKNGESELFNAPANETAQLTDWVLLGTLQSGGEVTLDVTLNVPIEMGDDYANEIGYLDWQFKVEEIPVEDPDTGDSSDLLLYGSVMAVCVLAVIVLLVVMKKRKAEQK